MTRKTRRAWKLSSKLAPRAAVALLLRILQQAPDRPLGGGVLALTEVDVPDSSLGVDQILGGPVLIPVGGPGPVIVVLNDRVGQPILADRVPHVRRLLLERGFGRM